MDLRRLLVAASWSRQWSVRLPEKTKADDGGASCRRYQVKGIVVAGHVSLVGMLEKTQN
jgi:hypothetical protein